MKKAPLLAFLDLVCLRKIEPKFTTPTIHWIELNWLLNKKCSHQQASIRQNEITATLTLPQLNLT